VALNPAFVEQLGRTLPISFGYVKRIGDPLLFTVTTSGVNYNLNIHGEGVEDGKEIPVMYIPPLAPGGSGLGTGNGTTSLCRGLMTDLPIFAQLTIGSRFHNGSLGTKGSGLAFLPSVGENQFPDTWFANFPNVTPVQAFSGMAYEITYGPGPMTVRSGHGADTMTFSPTAAPIGVYRGLRCRCFDSDGNVTQYCFTTNPAWHLVEVLLRYKIKPQQPGLAGLTDAEKALFNWPSVVAYADRCYFLLSNGQPRFCYNGIFAADQTLTDMLETLLRCSRGYITMVNGQITLNGDDGAESSFLFSGNHLVPGSLDLDEKNVASLPNIFVPKYRDLGVPAVAAVVFAEKFTEKGYGAMGLDSSSPFLPQGWGVIKIVSDGINPFTIGTVMVLGGSTDDAGGSSWDGNYMCAFPYGDGALTDIGVTEDGVTLLAAAGGSQNTLNAHGGYLGVENGRFAERAPTNVVHRAHQRATGGPDAPGLTSRLNKNPVEYDMGNSTFDQAIRLMIYEMVRTLGPDGPDWKAPKAGTVTGYLESVDANGNALIDQVPGKVITLDEWVSPEYTGDYEIQHRKIKTPFKNSLGTIDLTIQTKTDASAYTDVVQNADATLFAVPNSGLDMSDRNYGMRPAAVMQCTPSWDGADTISADDTQIWWAGDVLPTGYAFEVSGLIENTTYVLYMRDAARSGGGLTGGIQFFATPGSDFSAIPDGGVGYAALGVFTTGSGDISDSVGGYSYAGVWYP
jgi:hypothetical protein